MTRKEIAAAARIVYGWPDTFDGMNRWLQANPLEAQKILQTARAELAKLDSATVAERGNDNCLIPAAGESPAQSTRISELEAELARVKCAADFLLTAATEVNERGAIRGAQWIKLGSAIISVRAALKGQTHV